MENNNIIYQVVKSCEHCNKKCTKKIEDKTGYYENKILGEGGNFRCTNCKIIKPIDNFSLLHPKKSTRRRKFCRDCRNKQLREYYYAKKKKKELKDKPQ